MRGEPAIRLALLILAVLSLGLGVVEAGASPSVQPSPAPTPSPVGPSGPYHYLARWAWEIDAEYPGGGHWICPGGSVGCSIVDLRTEAQKGQRGGVGGWVWASTTTPRSIGPGATHEGLLIASFNTQKVSESVAAAITSRLGVPVDARDPHGILGELLTVRAATDGSRWGVLKGGSVTLNGRVAYETPGLGEPGEDPRHYALAMESLRQEYRDLRATTRGTSNQYLRVLDYWQEHYGIPAQEFVRGVPFEGTLPHETDYTDNFTEGADAGLDTHTPTPSDWGCGASCWTEVSGTWTVTAATDRLDKDSVGFESARAEQALSSSAMYSQITVTGGITANDRIGVAVRFNSSAENYLTCYYKSTASDYYHIDSVTAATFSTLIAEAGAAASAPFDIRMEVTAADAYSCTIDGNAVTGGTSAHENTSLRGGLFARESSLEMDDFAYGDLAPAGGGGATRPRVWYGSIR